MNLAIIVPLLVVGVTALAGLVGYLIDGSAEPEELPGDLGGDFTEIDIEVTKRIKVTKHS
ncbi:MAG TPA: hypothetical protein VH639_12580 [Bryobacteraceae bacterium]|jgi:hypothetical protein